MRLTTTDAFFVAYQERSGILMHFGAEVELAGPLDRARVEAAVAEAVVRWPALGCTLRRSLGGLRWAGAPDPRLVHATTDPDEVGRWRNAPIDPFREPPFGVLCVRLAPDRHTLAFRSHHAVADGALFFAIVSAILGRIASDAAAEPAPPPTTAAPHPLAVGQLWRQAKLLPLWRHTRWLAREARAERSARISVREVTAGDISITTRALDAAARRALFGRAAAARVRAPWLVAAAWLRALHAWNLARGAGANPVLSLEVPVGLRRGALATAGTGNHLAVLTLFADASAPLADVARSLWRDYADGLRRRAHLAVPLFSAPVRALPWPIFRRVAVTSTSTGFASSHFTWLVREPDIRAEVAGRSRGALAMVDQRIYTPVCLHMGAALSVLAFPDRLQLTITHRLTGLSPDDAARLAELVVGELS